MRAVSKIEDTFASVARDFGYSEVRTPGVEFMYLFTSAGELAPATLERVYSFLDYDGWTGERVAIRPDSTIPCARMYAETFPPGTVAKLFYRQPIYRFTHDDTPREVSQCGAEVLGYGDQLADMELIILASSVLERLNVGKVTVRVSDTRIARSILASSRLGPAEQLVAYDQLLAGDIAVLGDLGTPKVESALSAAMSIPPGGSAYVANLRAILGSTESQVDVALAHLQMIAGGLEAIGITPIVNLFLARDFEYYSSLVTAFELVGTNVGRGGRYDDLVRVIGGHDAAASGFALDVNALIPHVTVTNDEQSAVFVAPVREGLEAMAYACSVARYLVVHGYPAQLVPSIHGLGSRVVECVNKDEPLRLVDGDGTKTFSDVSALVEAVFENGNGQVKERLG